MAKIDDILKELDLRTIARRVDFRHSQVLHAFPPGKDIPDTPDEFFGMIEKYNDYHVEATLGSRAGWLPEVKSGEARRLVEQMFKGGGLIAAYQTAIVPLDKGIYGIYEQLKNYWAGIHREYYISTIIDKYVCPLSWDEKVAIVRQLQKSYKAFSSGYGSSKPEELANSYKQLIAAHVDAAKKFIPTYFRV